MQRQPLVVVLALHWQTCKVLPIIICVKVSDTKQNSTELWQCVRNIDIFRSQKCCCACRFWSA